MTLQRIVVNLRLKEVVLRVLYSSEDGPDPNTKARRREVTELTHAGLTQALEALEGGAEVVGTSGFTTREDILTATSPDAARPLEGGPWESEVG